MPSLAAARSTSASASRMSGRVRSRSAGTSPGRNRAGPATAPPRSSRNPAHRGPAAAPARAPTGRPPGASTPARPGALPAHAGRVGVLRRAQAGVQPHLRQPLGLAVQLGHLRQQRDLAVGHAQVEVVAHHGRDHRHAQALLAGGGQVGVRAGLQPAARPRRTGPAPRPCRCWRGNRNPWPGRPVPGGRRPRNPAGSASASGPRLRARPAAGARIVPGPGCAATLPRPARSVADRPAPSTRTADRPRARSPAAWDQAPGTCAGSSGTGTDMQPDRSALASSAAQRSLNDSGQRCMGIYGVADGGSRHGWLDNSQHAPRRCGAMQGLWRIDGRGRAHHARTPACAPRTPSRPGSSRESRPGSACRRAPSDPPAPTRPAGPPARARSTVPGLNRHAWRWAGAESVRTDGRAWTPAAPAPRRSPPARPVRRVCALPRRSSARWPRGARRFPRGWRRSGATGPGRP